LCHTLFFGPGFKRRSQLFGAHERPADILIFRTGIERNQPIAVLAVRLKSVVDFLRPLSGSSGGSKSRRRAENTATASRTGKINGSLVNVAMCSK
jgi:hypothetical protein